MKEMFSLKSNKKISMLGFIEDDNLIANDSNVEYKLYPIYKVKCKTYNELIELLKNQSMKDIMYNITIKKIISWEEKNSAYKEYIKDEYYDSKQLFEEFLKVWLKNMIENPNIHILPNNDNEIIFYIY